MARKDFVDKSLFYLKDNLSDYSANKTVQKEEKTEEPKQAQQLEKLSGKEEKETNSPPYPKSCEKRNR